jgi:nitrate reductase NapA
MVSLPNLNRYRQAATKGDRFIVVSESISDPYDGRGGRRPPRGDVARARGDLRETSSGGLSTSSGWWRRPVEATGDAWQMIEVARRLGFEKLFPYQPGGHVEQIWEEYRRFHQEPQDALPAASEAPRECRRDVALRGRPRDSVAL